MSDDDKRDDGLGEEYYDALTWLAYAEDVERHAHRAYVEARDMRAALEGRVRLLRAGGK